MSNRTSEFMKALGLNNTQFGALMGADASVVSRLRNGQPETGQQVVLLDLLALRHGLPHLTAEAFAAGSLLPAGGSPAAPVAPPGDGGGVSSSEAGAA